MEHVIEFTSMLRQLNDAELKQFVLNVIKNNGKELITKLFFNYFKEKQLKIKPHTEIIRNIISARENKPKQLACKCECIDKLPSALIGECASYLNEQEYFRFAQCNQQIFVATNNPLKLYELSVRKFNKYPQSKSMQKFKSVKRLTIDIAHFNKNVSTSNQSIWKNTELDILSLCNNRKNHLQSSVFFKKNAFNFNKIREIRLNGFGSDRNPHDFGAFCDILRDFKNVESLRISRITLSDGIFKEIDIMSWLSNLKHFKYGWSDNQLYRTIIKSVGHQLKSLAITNQTPLPNHIYRFPKLEELALRISDFDDLNPFKNVKSLKRISICAVSKAVLQKSINFAIKKQLYLKRIQIQLDMGNFKHAMTAIESALFGIKNMKKNELYIGINCYDIDISIINDIPFAMCRLLNMLERTKIREFMVRLEFVCVASKDILDLKKEFDDMKGDYSVNYATSTSSHWIDFIVSNKQCKINGNQMIYTWG